jgi:hypothetical protein
MSINNYSLTGDYERFGRLNGQPINKNAALTTNFRFSLIKVPNVTYFCTSITTPTSNSNPLSYDYITAAPLKLPGAKSSTDMSIRFIISEDFKNYMEMVKWIRSGSPYRDFQEIKPENELGLGDGQILLLNNSKVPLQMITFRNLIPTVLSGFTLSNSDADPPVLTATVSFVYDTFTVQTL